MNGIILVNKEQGWTSNDVVSKMKGILHERRIGHSGTLDPMATGLLVVFVGRATRAVEFSVAHSKKYRALLRLGVVTDTQDITGSVIEENSVAVSDSELDEVIHLFIGDVLQIPPMYSALKVNGKRLYDLARSGIEIERKARSVNISSIEVISRYENDIVIDVCCSSGTYIRTLCNDIGKNLGCGATMAALDRIMVGDYNVSDSHTLSEIQQAVNNGCVEELFIPVDSLFVTYPEIHISGTDEAKVRVGNTYKCTCEDGYYRVYGEKSEFLMLGKSAGGVMKTVKNFFEV